MNIFMTIGATDADFPEAPCRLFLMTFNARGGHVSTLQLELPCIMLVDGEGKKIEALCRMTPGAILHPVLGHELAFMVIGMAIRATVVFDRIGQGCFVT